MIYPKSLPQDRYHNLLKDILRTYNILSMASKFLKRKWQQSLAFKKLSTNYIYYVFPLHRLQNGSETKA